MKKLLVCLTLTLLLFGCAKPQNKTEEGTRKGAAIGAAAGAILGQVIGGDTKATMIGAGIGVLAGTVIGRSYGKKADEQERELRRQLAAIEDANVQRHADILSVTFLGNLLFTTGSSQLKPGAEEEIFKVSQVLNKYTDTSVRVDGHTDNVGNAEYNLKLSELRAESVKRVMMSQGVHGNRIQTLGFGFTAPVADNSTEEGRRLNRRVVITINPPQG